MSTYNIRLGSRTSQSWYHEDIIGPNGKPIPESAPCGSSFHGLSTTLERLAVEDKVAEGLAKIRDCLGARRYEIERRERPDPSHNRAVEQLLKLYTSYQKLARKTAEEKKKITVN